MSRSTCLWIEVNLYKEKMCRDCHRNTCTIIFFRFVTYHIFHFFMSFEVSYIMKDDILMLTLGDYGSSTLLMNKNVKLIVRSPNENQTIM